MKPLPPPQSFAEGQRLIYGLLAAGAGVFCGACAVAMIALLMWGGWSAAEEHSIVGIFGWALGGFISAMAAVIVGLLACWPAARSAGSKSARPATARASKPTEPHNEPRANRCRLARRVRAAAQLSAATAAVPASAATLHPASPS